MKQPYLIDAFIMLIRWYSDCLRGKHIIQYTIPYLYLQAVFETSLIVWESGALESSIWTCIVVMYNISISLYNSVIFFMCVCVCMCVSVFMCVRVFIFFFISIPQYTLFVWWYLSLLHLNLLHLLSFLVKTKNRKIVCFCVCVCVLYSDYRARYLRFSILKYLDWKITICNTLPKFAYFFLFNVYF